MKKDKDDITNFVSDDEKTAVKKFWRRSFIFYAGIEIVILVIQYIITYNECVPCLMPPAFYLATWLLHLLFTGILWYVLNSFYTLQYWKITLLNIAVFLVHYFLLIGAYYTISHSGQNWLVWDRLPSRNIASFIYTSWDDIGKYVLKLTAFYVLKFYFEYKKAERQRIQLALVNKDMQLNLLKQQLSPHFYFNTLNNLYGLARSNNKKLPEALSQLSNIMHYVIVDCNQPKVLLSQEVDFLQSYIALEKLRYEQNTVIEMNVLGNANGQTIIPLLLIQFVENAFKHGMKEKSDENWMKVTLKVSNHDLLFTVDNSIYESNINEGIGISSVKRILSLSYEGKYEMYILQEANHYSVTLKLNLL